MDPQQNQQNAAPNPPAPENNQGAVNYAQNQVQQTQAQQPVAPPQAQATVPGAQSQAAPPVMDARKQTNPNSTQNSLLISEIRDGIVILNDGSFRSVIYAKSINFDLMSPEEREAVEYSYQGFLNSLYFPVQISIRSQKVDIRPYLERLDSLRTQQENMLLALMMEDYIQFIDVLAQETNIMDKQFYIVVPYYSQISAVAAVDEGKKFLGGVFSKKKDEAQQVITINEPEMEKAKTELANRVQSVMAGLQQIGVQAVPLSTEELIELYYDVYNPDTATRQKIGNFENLQAPVVEKGEGDAPQPHLGGGL